MTVFYYQTYATLFIISGVVPSEWLGRSVQEADFYAVVFSEGTRLAFQGIQLKGSQHWQDIFGPGVTYVLQVRYLSSYLYMRQRVSVSVCL